MDYVINLYQIREIEHTFWVNIFQNYCHQEIYKGLWFQKLILVHKAI